MEPRTTENGALFAAAEAWAAQDPDPDTAAELRALLDAARGNAPVDAAGNGTATEAASGAGAGQGSRGADAGSPVAAAAEGALAELADRFSGTLEFGTAGLRAALGAGPNRMNRVVVRRTAAGLARYLLEAAGGSYTPRAVVGFDARHNSDVFAAESAAILTAAGIETFLLPDRLPTPVLAWAVRALRCEAGIMVTASHNPPQDNGYKVYLGGRTVAGPGQGAQIVAPMDRDIADRISYDGPLAGIALAEGGWTVLPGNGEDGDVAERYIADIVALVPDPAAPDTGTATTGTATTRTAPDAGAAVATMADRARLRIVLTPLHGVGGDTMLRAFARAGFVDVVVVAEQAAPDPDFPTVAFPNPEEPGAIDLALELAASVDADLVIANDPDADRCAVAARFPDAGWRMLRGDEVGSLLGSHVAARLVRQPAGGTAAAQPPVFANSIVSSRQLGRIAAAHGLAHATTLTGFKWISRVPGLAYGYEEALGYCVAPDLVRDKDGMSAALLVAELATALKAAGSSLPAALDDLALAHGLHATDQLSVRVPSLDLLGELMGTLRAAAPPSFAGSPVTTAADLSAGATGLPPTEGMLYLTADDTRVIVRPSGTEPKLKCYLEVIEPADSAAALPGARARARERLDRVRADLHRILGLQPHAT